MKILPGGWKGGMAEVVSQDLVGPHCTFKYRIPAVACCQMVILHRHVSPVLIAGMPQQLVCIPAP